MCPACRRLGCFLAFAFAWLGQGPEQASPLRQAVAGEPDREAPAAMSQEVPAFFVRDVTSSRPHRAVCLVCRYGERPVVLLAVRKLDPRVVALLRRFDQLAEGHRATGLRAFAVFLGGELKHWQPRLYTLHRRHRLRLPLVLPVQRGGPDQLAFSARVPVTVLLYRNRRIVKRYELQLHQLTPERIRELEQAARAMLHPGEPLAAPCPRAVEDCPAG